DQFLQAVFDATDGVEGGLQAPVADLRGHDELRSTVAGVGDAADVAESLQVIDQLAHRLRGHVGSVGQLGQPRAVEVDVGKDPGVSGPQGIPGGDDPCDDLVAQPGPGPAEHVGG